MMILFFVKDVEYYDQTKFNFVYLAVQLLYLFTFKNQFDRVIYAVTKSKINVL